MSRWFVVSALAALAALSGSGCGAILDDASPATLDCKRAQPEVEFVVESNPPDCANADEMERSFDRVRCEWKCARYKGSSSRRVIIRFAPVGEYTEKSVRSWHVSEERVSDSFYCSDEQELACSP